jgi:hypothetical protein
MLVTHDSAIDLFQAFALSGESMMMITSKGENVELGTLKGDVYTPATSAEDIYHIHNHGNWYGNISPWNNYGNYNRGRIGGNYGRIGGNYGSNNSYGSSGFRLFYWWLL